MQPKADMVPKECFLLMRACRDVFQARLQWQGMVMQYFCHHTICHPNSSYVTTKLYETLACGCNNNTIFQNELFSRFLPSTYVAWQRRSLGDAAEVARWWIYHFSCLKSRFCVTTMSNIMIIYCKVVQWYSMRLVCIAGIFPKFWALIRQG